MRCLQRNKQSLHYANLDYVEEIIDEYGNKTGQYRTIRTEPILMRANISGAVGEAGVQQFGNNIQYDKVIVLDNVNTDVDENTVFWIDRDISNIHNYIVVKISKTLNTVSIAIRQVDVSE